MTTRHAARPAAARAGEASVSGTSAQRFAARVRLRRRRRVLAALVTVAVLAGAGWLCVLSPWATVRTIEVRRVPVRVVAGLPSSRIPDAQLRAQAEEELGHPMLAARVSDVQARLRRVPLVRSAQVRRSWPSTLVLTVQEREPVAAVPTGEDGPLQLVDADGVPLGTVSSPPPGLPSLDVDLDQAGSASLQACLQMLRRLPAAVARRVRSVGADSPDGIRLTLSDGAQVQWGDATRTPRKAEVLLALLPRKAAAYDVRSPDTPAIRPR